MDSERKLRFLYPPLLSLASLLLGFAFSPSKSSYDLVPWYLRGEGLSSLVGVLAGGGVVVLSLGYLVGTIRIAFLTLASKAMGVPTFEAHVREPALARILNHLRTASTSAESIDLYAVATFDHVHLPERI